MTTSYDRELNIGIKVLFLFRKFYINTKQVYGTSSTETGCAGISLINPMPGSCGGDELPEMSSQLSAIGYQKRASSFQKVAIGCQLSEMDITYISQINILL